MCMCVGCGRNVFYLVGCSGIGHRGSEVVVERREAAQSSAHKDADLQGMGHAVHTYSAMYLGTGMHDIRKHQCMNSTVRLFVL